LKFNGLNLTKIVVVLLLCLALLFGGQYIYRHIVLDKPMGEELTAVEGVKDYRVVSAGGEKEIVLIMSPLNNLQESFLKAQEIVYKVYSDQTRVKVSDNTNDILQEVWYQSQFTVYEGIYSGHFVDMKHQLNDIAAQYSKVQIRAYVDNERVYFQAVVGEHFLYRVINREYGGDPVA